MNTILQKRIEEAANEFDKEGLRVIFENGANFILNNLWISVDEALPEKEGRYLCNYHYKFSNSDDECDCVDFGLFKDGKWYVANNEVTHWTPIPQLKGGEE